ncbi:MAG: hypothetical protein WAW10_04870 [Gallionella sp.]
MTCACHFESEQDCAKLAHPELYLADHQDKLVIIDEVHQSPGLFPVLRGMRRKQRRNDSSFLLGYFPIHAIRFSAR